MAVDYGTTQDGATWFWHVEKGPEMYRAAIQCDGYYVTIDGIAFYSEQDCWDWIAEAVKAQVRFPGLVIGS
jgi:hypothetical protein